MRWFYLPAASAAILMLAGCGDIVWFPDTTPAATSTPTTDAAAPNAFAFAAMSTSVNTVANNNFSPVLSNTVTLTGTNTKGWPVTFKNFSSPESILNVGGGSAQAVLGYNPGAVPNVFPNQTLQVSLVPSATAGKTVKATVTVGTFTTSFSVKTTN
jgi:hypothetical protein